MTKNKSRPLAILATGLLWVGCIQAQESVNASGSNATGTGGSSAYSIGQVAYSTNPGVTGSVAQGVQHAYEIFVVGIKETEWAITLTVFPNPTAHNVMLQIGEYYDEQLCYQLFDMQGKLLKRAQIADKLTQINAESLPPSTYLIRVLNQENQLIQSFKIIKN